MKTHKEVTYEELKEAVTDAHCHFINKEKKKAHEIAGAKRNEGLAVVLRYNNHPEYIDLSENDREEIALLFVNYKIHESGDSCWFIDPLTFDDIATIVDDAIRIPANIDDTLGGRFASTYEEQISDFYNNIIYS